MPDAFAHQHFGDIVFSALPGDLKYRITPYLDLYNIGLQGPDFLFFYNPLKHNEVFAQGSALHKQTGREFWTLSANTLKTTAMDHEASLSYLLGMMCHYSMDSVCHTFVKQYEKDHGVIHSDIEGEFDRYLMASLNLVPHEVDQVKRFRPKREYAEVIAPFTQKLDPEITYDALKGFHFWRNVFRCPHRLKREFLYAVFRATGKYHDYRGQIVNTEPYDGTDSSDRELYRLLHDHVHYCSDLIESFVYGTDTGDLTPFFSKDGLDIPFDGLDPI